MRPVRRVVHAVENDAAVGAFGVVHVVDFFFRVILDPHRAGAARGGLGRDVLGRHFAFAGRSRRRGLVSRSRGFGYGHAHRSRHVRGAVRSVDAGLCDHLGDGARRQQAERQHETGDCQEGERARPSRCSHMLSSRTTQTNPRRDLGPSDTCRNPQGRAASRRLTRYQNELILGDYFLRHLCGRRRAPA